MTENHLLIGLGGTGVRIVRAFRALLDTGQEAEVLPECKVEVLVIDVDQKTLSADHVTDEDCVSARSQLHEQRIVLRPTARWPYRHLVGTAPPFQYIGTQGSRAGLSEQQGAAIARYRKTTLRGEC